MLDWGQPMYALEQMLMAHLDEGARDEFEDRWEGAEDFIVRVEGALLHQLKHDIAEAFATLSPSERFAYFELDNNFHGPDDFDEWLRVLARRMEQALAGIHSEPLSDPEGPHPADRP